MVQHMIIWEMKDSLSAEEKTAQAALIKENLESLNGKIDGMLSLTVQTTFLEAVGGDLMLLSSFESVEALHGYAKNPEHNRIADTYVRPYMKARHCMDFNA